MTYPYFGVSLKRAKVMEIKLKELIIIEKGLCLLEDKSYWQSKSKRLLDNFSHALTTEELENISLSFVDLNLQNEHKYLELFEALYHHCNGKKIFVELDYQAMDELKHLNILNDLDYRDKRLWVHQMLNINKEHVTNYFLVEDLDVLLMLVKMCIRELEFVSFHFESIGCKINGTYDCTMEVFFDDPIYISSLETLALEKSLFLREYCD